MNWINCPSELLEKIFAKMAESSPPSTTHVISVISDICNINKSSPDWMSLTRVCRWWRTIFFRDCRLLDYWASFRFQIIDGEPYEFCNNRFNHYRWQWLNWFARAPFHNVRSLNMCNGDLVDNICCNDAERLNRDTIMCNSPPVTFGRDAIDRLAHSLESLTISSWVVMILFRPEDSLSFFYPLLETTHSKDDELFITVETPDEKNGEKKKKKKKKKRLTNAPVFERLAWLQLMCCVEFLKGPHDGLGGSSAVVQTLGC